MSPLSFCHSAQKNIATPKGVRITNPTTKDAKMTSAKLMNAGAGMTTTDGKFHFQAGQWFQVRKGNSPLVKVKPERVADLSATYATDLARYHRSLIGRPANLPTPSGVSPKPSLTLHHFGGTPARMREIAQRMGKIA